MPFTDELKFPYEARYLAYRLGIPIDHYLTGSTEGIGGIELCYLARNTTKETLEAFKELWIEQGGSTV